MRDEREDEDERKRLLWPDWSARHNGPKYDDLDEASKDVWRKTRLQAINADTFDTWTQALANAIHKRLITAEEARQALERETDT